MWTLKATRKQHFSYYISTRALLVVAKFYNITLWLSESFSFTLYTLGTIPRRRPWKLSNLQYPRPPVHLRPQLFHSLNLGRPVLKESFRTSPTNYGKTITTYMWSNKIKTKTKPGHVTFKLNTCSVVQFIPQEME